MTELWTEDETAQHFVGASGEVVVVIAREGSQEDLRHITATTSLVERLSRNSKTTKLLFVMPRSAKPPNAEVRDALLKASRRLDGKLAHIAVVITGQGFGAAVHRAVITGLVSLMRSKVPLKVKSSIEEGLRYLLDDNAKVAELTRLCEQRLDPPTP